MSLISMSHVMHLNEFTHLSRTWMSHVTFVNKTCYTNKWSCHSYKWVMSRTWKSHVTHTNKSFHTWEWVMSHTWMSHSIHTRHAPTPNLFHTCVWVMSHVWKCHVLHVNESCLTRLYDKGQTLSRSLAPFHTVHLLCCRSRERAPRNSWISLPTAYRQQIRGSEEIWYDPAARVAAEATCTMAFYQQRNSHPGILIYRIKAPLAHTQQYRISVLQNVL